MVFNESILAIEFLPLIDNKEMKLCRVGCCWLFFCSFTLEFLIFNYFLKWQAENSGKE